MLQRRTFHECADELMEISDDFRAAHTNIFTRDRAKRDKILVDTSRRGVEVMRLLALSIGEEAEFAAIHNDARPVGAFRASASAAEANETIRDYRPPYAQLHGFRPIGLRQALNKIALADPTRSGFFVDGETHDLILSGLIGGDRWIAVISLLDLCKAIKSLPNFRTRQ